MLSLSRSVPAVLLTMAAASLVQLSAGCASTGPDNAQATVSSMSTLEASLAAASTQIGATLDALNQLMEKADADLRPEYDAYGKALDSLESSAKTVEKEAAAMRTKAQQYYTEWEKSQASIQNPEMKEKSVERRLEMQERQEEANANAQAFQKRFAAFVTELRDIETFLGNDLNTAGVDAIESSVKHAKSEGKEIRETVDELSEKLAEVRKATSAQGPATPPPPAN